MTTTPTLTVLLPVYNTGKYLQDTIESILNQSFSDFEIIIADDGSRDNSIEVINEFAKADDRIVVSNNDSNQGKTATINRVAQMAKGRFLTIHDSDDISLENRFEKQLQKFIENPEIGMCGTSFDEINGNGAHFNTIIQPTSYEEVMRCIDEKAPFHGPTMIIRKELLDTEKYIYRPFFQSYKEDCDLAYRLALKAPCVNTKEVLYHYRILPNSLSKRLNTKKLVTYKIIIELAKQRKEKGADYLDLDDQTGIEELLERLSKPYIDDPSLEYIESASFLMYYELYKPALGCAFNAIKTSPFSFNNYRLLQYCLRKMILRI